MPIAYLGLGANIGNPAANLAEATFRIASEAVRVLRASSIWETAPQGKLDQPWFLNQVIEIETDLTPGQLFARLQEVEREMGRVRFERNGPRLIDIDILLFGDQCVTGPGLEIPHPRIAERRFVLEPLAELAPDLRHPVTNKSVREMLAAVAGQQACRRGF
jgi:2-amino-4-hydroxy-6-hydroxymethyldihydropteridine diphosphokinase